jgi:hypothetical protein
MSCSCSGSLVGFSLMKFVQKSFCDSNDIEFGRLSVYMSEAGLHHFASVQSHCYVCCLMSDK